MGKIAIISDIHGNLTALEAVCKDISKRRIKRVICLGDLVGKGPQPAECVNRIRELCEVTLQGNWDHNVNQPHNKEGILWQQSQLGAERLDYLKQLPFSVDLHLSGRWIRLFHASSKDVYHRVTRKASRKEKLSLFEHTGMTGFPEVNIMEEAAASDSIPVKATRLTPDVVGYGDLHIPFMQTIKNKNKEGLLLFNTGSVGASYEGIPQACYSIIEGKPDASINEPFSIQTVRVPYDVEKAIAIAEQLQMPGIDRFRYEMRTGLEQ
ncbi:MULTISPECIES: metallophosphoesterase family protein [unclassified Paenibacillus]|uniref:metallophosphoesterase family protein n=1 Tax=unclassified Paenibacillus TaxID=185978 RepID=UPI00363C5CD0